MSTFDERARDWDTPERHERAVAVADADPREYRPGDDDACHRHRGRDRIARPGVGRRRGCDGPRRAIRRDARGRRREAGDGRRRQRQRPIRLDLLTDPPPDDPFDLAVSLLVLHHLPGPARPRSPPSPGLLRPGGRLALADLDTEDGSFHDADAEGIYHLGFDRDGSRRPGADGRLRRRRVPYGDPRSSTRATLSRSSCCSRVARPHAEAVATGRSRFRIESAPKKAFAKADRLARLGALGQDGRGGARGAGGVCLALRRRRGRGRRARSSRPPTTIVEETGGGSGTEFGVPSAITDLDRRPVDGRRGRTAGRHRRGRLDGLRSRRRVRAGRAAQGPARRWPGPRQDDRPRRRVRLVLRPRDRDPRHAAGPGRSARPSRRCAPRCSRCSAGRRMGRRWPAGSGRPATPRAGSPGTRSTTPGRWRTGRSPADGSLHAGRRLAGNSPPTSVASIGRGASINPTAAAASPISDGRASGPAARSSRTAVSPSALDSFRPSGRRMSR